MLTKVQSSLPNFYVLAPDAGAAKFPVVVDSPHSWGVWPDDVQTIASAEDLATSWDAFVDELWLTAVQFKAPLLAAKFHRAYLDANRARDDIDPSLLAETWPVPLRPTDKTQKGFGLIRKLILPGKPIYATPLCISEVQQRIETCYDPYHQQLAQLIDRTHQQFGQCLHLNCHSMKSTGNAMNDDNGKPRPDIVISDHDGVTSSSNVTQHAAGIFRSLGYQVGINNPYKGAELIRKYANPAKGRYSLQIELNRALYMHEDLFMKNESFAKVAQDLQRFTEQMSQHLLQA
jgi:N-formylglutamate deformylase